MWHEYQNITSVGEALDILAEHGDRARIIAGATDLILEIERGVRDGIDTLVDVTRIPGLDQISQDEHGLIHLGPLVTHNHCIASKLIRGKALPLAQAAWEVGSPQIRNRGTVAGNLVTASPANDTITPLMALGALVTLRSSTRERVVPLQRFYRGVRETVMQPDEMLVDIAFPALESNQLGTFIRLALRQAQAISLVNVAVVATFTGNGSAPLGQRSIKKAVITLGAVAPVIIHAQDAENYLAGRRLDQETIEKTALLAEEASTPIDDVRSSRDYRREMVRVCTLRALRDIANGEISKAIPEDPILLSVGKDHRTSATLNSTSMHSANQQIMHTRINGKEYTFDNGFEKSLLRLLREDAGLIGTKEGCAEGECGACTVFLDGAAVMSCLVPAARAHEAEIITIEGLVLDGKLHPVQHTFIDEGAVQCGYCTPGFIMSAAKLLEERAHPTQEEIKHSITGNLCRCTGYYKIISAIEKASHMEFGDD